MNDFFNIILENLQENDKNYSNLYKLFDRIKTKNLNTFNNKYLFNLIRTIFNFKNCKLNTKNFQNEFKKIFGLKMGDVYYDRY